jgi:uncharacterized protein
MSAPGAAEAMSTPDNAFLDGLAAEATRIYRQGTYAEIVRQRLRELAWSLPFALFVQGWGVMAMFLLGLWAGKRQVFRNVDAFRPLLRRLLVVGLLVGLPLNLLTAATYATATQTFSPLTLLAPFNGYIGAPLLSFAYIAGITLLAQHDVWRKRLAPLASVGRMALSNYLLQSIVCTTIFYSYGLGLFGQVGPAAGLLLSVAIYALQVPLSVLWLRHFQYGPAEWLWRTMTYGRLQPIRARRPLPAGGTT